ncbi:hypothetical protein, partial [Pseudonocardia sp. EV170527-09]|uniref:hypothetical protein n=1 Tax=Pseudonocardia sp. EV170527-09 TaxID=2603411 RepID=UPI001961BCBF
GDFSMVGMASAVTAYSFDHPFAAVEDGRFGYRRVVAGQSWKLGDDTDVLVAAEQKRYDGP